LKQDLLQNNGLSTLLAKHLSQVLPNRSILDVSFDSSFEKRLHDTISQRLKDTPLTPARDQAISFPELRDPLEPIELSSRKKWKRIDEMILFNEQPSMYDIIQITSVTTIPITKNYPVEVLAFLSIASKMVLSCNARDASASVFTKKLSTMTDQFNIGPVFVQGSTIDAGSFGFIMQGSCFSTNIFKMCDIMSAYLYETSVQKQADRTISDAYLQVVNNELKRVEFAYTRDPLLFTRIAASSTLTLKSVS
jgi:Zn-dependent M16 (insulinase) family peptidase